MYLRVGERSFKLLTRVNKKNSSIFRVINNWLVWIYFIYEKSHLPNIAVLLSYHEISRVLRIYYYSIHNSVFDT